MPRNHEGHGCIADAVEQAVAATQVEQEALGVLAEHEGHGCTLEAIAVRELSQPFQKATLHDVVIDLQRRLIDEIEVNQISERAFRAASDHIDVAAERIDGLIALGGEREQKLTDAIARADEAEGNLTLAEQTIASLENVIQKLQGQNEEITTRAVDAEQKFAIARERLSILRGRVNAAEAEPRDILSDDFKLIPAVPKCMDNRLERNQVYCESAYCQRCNARRSADGVPELVPNAWMSNISRPLEGGPF